MSHFLVDLLRFTRSEFVRSLEGVTAEEAVRRFEPMNSISWTIGHLASGEQTLWVWFPQGRIVVPGLTDLVGYGMPATTPPLDEMWAAWRTVTAAADVYLDSLTEEKLFTYLERDGKRRPDNVGAMVCRNMYHYWEHLGECAAIRQLLGHRNLPEFVGNMSAAQYHR